MLFDKDELKKVLKEKGINDQNGLNNILRDLTKEVIEALYEGEMTEHLGYEKKWKK